VRESADDAPHAGNENEKITRLLMKTAMRPSRSQRAWGDVDERGIPGWTGSEEDLESRRIKNGHRMVREMGSESLERRVGTLTGTLTALAGGQGKTRHDTALQIKKYARGKIKGTRSATHILRTVDRKRWTRQALFR
jgi:hypothetical protein